MNEVINAIELSPSLYRGTSFIDGLDIFIPLGAAVAVPHGTGGGGGSGGGSPPPPGRLSPPPGGSFLGLLGSSGSFGSPGGSAPAGKSTATSAGQGGYSFFVFLWGPAFPGMGFGLFFGDLLPPLLGFSGVSPLTFTIGLTVMTSSRF